MFFFFEGGVWAYCTMLGVLWLFVLSALFGAAG